MFIYQKEGETFEQAYERTKKFEAEVDWEYRKPKKVNERFLNVDGFITLFIDKTPKCIADRKCVVYEQYERPISFEEIFTLFNVKKKDLKDAIIFVVIDAGTRGDIWRMSTIDGEDDFTWWGETRGYA